MLILSRKVGEKLAIGQGVEIVVLRVSSTKVRVGIVAPQGTQVRRSELEPRDAKKTEEEPPRAA